jgi:hypothetical protein
VDSTKATSVDFGTKAAATHDQPFRSAPKGEGVQMKMQSFAANEIKNYIRDHKKEQNMAVRVELDGKVEVLDVYRIPTSFLRYNIRNGRFASELRHKEAELKRKLDSSNVADAKIIQKLLLEQSESETDSLMKDIEKHGQIEPGIITYDGYVINANRRFAIINALHDRDGDSKWEYLTVGVLPDQVNEKDLWKIEAGLQFAKDFRLEYGPINELLKLREGINCGIDAKQIAATLLGRFTAKDIEERIRRLELIDSYLELVGKAGDYTSIGIERSMEKFVSLHSNVIATLGKSDLDKGLIHRVTQVGLALIKDKDGHHGHLDIRKLASIARNDTARDVLFKDLPEDPFDADKDLLRDAFGNAKDVIDSEKEKEKPERLLQRALTALKSIDPASSHLASSGAQGLVQSLLEVCASLERNQ